MRSTAETIQLTGVDPARGLTAAQVEASRAANGRNVLTPPPQTPLWKLFLDKFNDPIIRILIVAAALSITVAVWKADTQHYIEGIAICVAVFIAGGVSFISEYRSRREFELLNAESESVPVRVRRDGHIREIRQDELVVGDIVVLEAGHEVPADGRVTRAVELSVNQSLMTGEVEPVHKAVADRDSTDEPLHSKGGVLRGTLVVEGNGEIVVTEVGDATSIGSIARMLRPEELEESKPQDPVHETATRVHRRRVQQRMDVDRTLTPLQRRLTELANMISRVGYAAAALVFIGMMIVGVLNGAFASGEFHKISLFVLDAFMITVVIIVVAVPEGLPMSVTISLALAMRRMTRANALVRQMMATETVGSTTVICSDKTGTLTENRMTVQGLTWEGSDAWEAPVPDDLDAERWKAVARGEAKLPAAKHPFEHWLINSCVNATAHLQQNDDGTLQPIGNPTEAALLAWWNKHGLDYQPLRDRADVLLQLAFSSDRKRMSTVVRPGDGDGVPVMYTKGAPDLLLPLCTQASARDGSLLPMSDELRQTLERLLHDAAEKAQRVLCFAHRKLDSLPHDEAGLHEHRDELEQDLVLDGLVAIADPVRPEVPAALDRCRAAGIEVKMITGDNIDTARAISQEIGLLDTPDARVIDSAEFKKTSDDNLRADLKNIRVLARATPEDKHRMVSLLQEEGEVVAVTGDGTNDAPALKRADVGLSMGSGTAVAREASRIVLLDDSFATIVRAVSWGRGLYENIQRFLVFQLTINIAALGIAFLGAFLEPWTGTRTPLTAIQLLWINVIMDSFAAIALCSEIPHESVMRRKPLARDAFIITPAMTRSMFVTGIFYIVVILGLLFAIKPLTGVDASVQPWPTIIFTLFVMFQVFNLINCRSLEPRESALAGIGTNRAIILIALMIVVVQVLLVQFGGAAFRTEPISLAAWGLIILAASSVLIIGEVRRAIARATAAKDERAAQPVATATTEGGSA